MEIVESIVNQAKSLPVEERGQFYQNVVIELFKQAYSTEVALKAQQNWEDAFEKLEVEDSQLEVGFDFIPKVAQVGGFKSNSEVRKLFEQGGVRLRIGKKSFIVKLSRNSNE